MTLLDSSKTVIWSFGGGSFIRSRTREVMLPGGADMTLSRIPSISIQPITAIVRRMPCSMEQRCCLHTTATIGLCSLWRALSAVSGFVVRASKHSPL